MIIFFVIFLIFIIVFLNFIPNDTSVLITFSVFGILFFSVIFWMANGFYIDLKLDYKLIIRGKIEDRKISFFRSSGRSYRSVTIENNNHIIDSVHFKNAEEGDFVELHIAPKSSTSFELIKLKLGNDFQNLNQSKAFVDDSVEVGPRIEELSEIDKKLLFKYLRRNLLVNVLSLLFSSWLIIGLYFGELYMIIILFFPIPLLFIYSLYKIFKKIVIYILEIKSGKKVTYKSILVDKYHVRRRGNTYVFKTKASAHYVKQYLYEKIEANELIYISVSTKTKSVLSVERSNGEIVLNK